MYRNLLHTKECCFLLKLQTYQYTLFHPLRTEDKYCFM